MTDTQADLLTTDARQPIQEPARGFAPHVNRLPGLSTRAIGWIERNVDSNRSPVVKCISAQAAAFEKPVQFAVDDPVLLPKIPGDPLKVMRAQKSYPVKWKAIWEMKAGKPRLISLEGEPADLTEKPLSEIIQVRWDKWVEKMKQSWKLNDAEVIQVMDEAFGMPLFAWIDGKNLITHAESHFDHAAHEFAKRRDAQVAEPAKITEPEPEVVTQSTLTLKKPESLDDWFGPKEPTISIDRWLFLAPQNRPTVTFHGGRIVTAIYKDHTLSNTDQALCYTIETGTYKSRMHPGSKLLKIAPIKTEDSPVDTTAEPKTAEWILNEGKRGAFFAKYTEMCDRHNKAMTKDEREDLRRSTLKRLCGSETLKGYEGSEAALILELERDLEKLYPMTKETHIDESGTPVTAAVSTEPEQADSSNAQADNTVYQQRQPDAARHYNKQARVIPFPEAAFVVLFEMYDPNGKEEKFTIRDDNEFSGFRRKVEFQNFLRLNGYTDRPLLSVPFDAPASNVVPFAQPAAPNANALPMAAGQGAPVPAQAAIPTPPTGVPDKKDRVPGQVGTDTITGVKKTLNEGEMIIELWVNKGQYAEHHLRLESEHAMLIALGVDLAAMEVGTTYPVTWKADWVVTGNKNKAGTIYYRDVTAIRNS